MTRSTEGERHPNYKLMVAIDRNPYYLLGDACGDEHSDANNVVPLIMTEKIAKKLNGVDLKGRKYAFCGTPQLFHNPNGDQIVICADNIYPISCYKGDGNEMDTRISHSNYIFQKYDGTVGIAHTVTLLNCKVVGVDKFSNQSGKTKIEFFTELAVPALKAEAVTNKTYTNEMPIPEDRIVKFTVKGKKAEDMRKILIPGNILLITGRLFATPNDEVSVGGVVREVSIAKWATKKGA